jgi:hypothetical protein
MRQSAIGMEQELIHSFSDPCHPRYPWWLRCDPQFTIVSSNRTTCQIDQMPHTEAFADFPRLRTSGRIETAQQPITAEPLYPAQPATAATNQPLEDPGQLRGD